MCKKIDFVVTWVDGNDKNWRKEKQYHEEKMGINVGLNSDLRYRDWGFMKYWFRAVEKHAPWVNKIYFITEGHLPEWLNIENEKLEIVRHSDYIDEKYLPTFNSNVIELNIHNIKELSEQFVMFNDDMFLNKDVKEEDFFKNGLPCDIGIFEPIKAQGTGIEHVILNNLEVVNKYYNSRQVLKNSFSKFYKCRYGKHMIKNIFLLPWKNILGYYDDHIPVSYKKSIFKEVYELEKDLFQENYNYKFRSNKGISHWLIRYGQLTKGEFYPRSMSVGNSYSMNDYKEIIQDMRNSTHKMICLNDCEVEDFEYVKDIVLKEFEQKYPNKSKFEK